MSDSSRNTTPINVLVLSLLLHLSTVTAAFAFSSSRGRAPSYAVKSQVVKRLPKHASRTNTSSRSWFLSAKEKDEDVDKGMEQAFRELDALDSLGDLDDDSPLKDDELRKDIEGSVDKEDLKGKAPNVAPEEEIKRYTELYQDLQGDEQGEALYSEVLQDMGGTVKQSPKSVSEEIATTPPISTIDKGNNMEDFMNAALEQAMKEAKDKTPEQISSLSENILDDEDMMAEIRGVFDKANEELLQGLDEIRKEQSELAKASAEKSSQERMATEKENEIRMQQAQESMQKVLENVNKETQEVERAVADLKKAKEAMDADPMMRLVSGDLVKQAAMAGTILFSVRAIVETFAMVSGGGDGAGGHAVAALVQGAIGLACGAYFFLK